MLKKYKNFEKSIQALKESLWVPSDGDNARGGITAHSADIRHACEDDETAVRAIAGAEELAGDWDAR